MPAVYSTENITRTTGVTREYLQDMDLTVLETFMDALRQDAAGKFHREYLSKKDLNAPPRIVYLIPALLRLVSFVIRADGRGEIPQGPLPERIGRAVQRLGIHENLARSRPMEYLLFSDELRWPGVSFLSLNDLITRKEEMVMAIASISGAYNILKLFLRLIEKGVKVAHTRSGITSGFVGILARSLKFQVSVVYIWHLLYPQSIVAASSNISPHELEVSRSIKTGGLMRLVMSFVQNGESILDSIKHHISYYAKLQKATSKAAYRKAICIMVGAYCTQIGTTRPGTSGFSFDLITRLVDSVEDDALQLDLKHQIKRANWRDKERTAARFALERRSLPRNVAQKVLHMAELSSVNANTPSSDMARTQNLRRDAPHFRELFRGILDSRSSRYDMATSGGIRGRITDAEASAASTLYDMATSGQKSRPCPPCTDQQVCNPSTGRCVIRSGQIGRRILARIL